MNTGHKNCILSYICNSDNPVKSFLKFEPEFETGTHFCYNNAATFMLSEIVGKYAGMTVYDFLSLRLFEPLGINNAHWNSFADGNSQGAVGLHVSTDDVAKLGLLYLNKDVYNGRRILSENWIKAATKVWSDTSTNGTQDWTSGYGFQFWKNFRDGFRGDGAFGQLCMVFPSKNMVFESEVYSENVQTEIDLVYELVEKLYGDSNTKPESLQLFDDKYNLPCEYNSDVITNKVYKCEKNRFGITFVKFSVDNGCIGLNFSDGTVWQTMKFGKGHFCENNVVIKSFKPSLEGLTGSGEKESVHFAAFCTFKDDILHLYFNYLDNPHTDEYVCSFGKNDFKMSRSKKFDFCYNEVIEGTNVGV